MGTCTHRTTFTGATHCYDCGAVLDDPAHKACDHLIALLRAEAERRRVQCEDARETGDGTLARVAFVRRVECMRLAALLEAEAP